MYVELLYQSVFFANFTKEEIDDILKTFSKKKISKGKKVISRGKQAKNFYLITSGEFKIINPQSNKIIDWARAGEILGEIAIITKNVHSADIIASLDSEVLSLSPENLRNLIKTHPKLSENIISIETKRLNKRNFHALEEYNAKYWVHVSNMENKISSSISVNLAIALTRSLMPKKVVYLHLAKSKPTPFQLLKFPVKNKQTEIALKNFKKYHELPAKDWTIKHSSGLNFLPIVSEDSLINILKPKEIPFLLSKLSEEFHLIFIDLGNQKSHSSKSNLILKQADKILVGLTPHPEELTQLEPWFTSLKKSNLFTKTHIYGNYIRISDNWREKVLIQYSNNQLKEWANHPIDFTLQGKIDSIDSIIKPTPLLCQKNFQRIHRSMAAAGRWISNRRIGLALGGGGARALASLGVLQELTSENIQIDSIAGTSLGTLVGAMYLMGGDSHVIAEMFSRYVPTDSAILDYNIPFVSFFRGKKIDRMLKEVFGKTRIEDLPVPFTAVAADIISGKEIHITKGLLWRAVRASMSLPVIFPPVKYGSCYLIDGAAMNNVPGNVLRSQGIHHVIGVNVTPLEDDSLKTYIKDSKLFRLLRPERHSIWKQWLKFFAAFRLMIKRPPILEIAYRSMMIEGAQLVRSKLSEFDVIIQPNVRDIGMFDFNKINEAIKHGSDEAKIMMPKIKDHLHGL